MIYSELKIKSDKTDTLLLRQNVATTIYYSVKLVFTPDPSKDLHLNIHAHIRFQLLKFNLVQIVCHLKIRVLSF